MKRIKPLLIGLGLLGILAVLFAVRGGRDSSHPGVKDVFGRSGGEVNIRRIGNHRVEYVVADLSAGEARARLRDRFRIEDHVVHGGVSGIQFGPLVFVPPTVTTSVQVTNAAFQGMLLTRGSSSHVMFYCMGGASLTNTPTAIFAGELSPPDGTAGIGGVAVPPPPSSTPGSSVSANSISSSHHHTTNELNAVWQHYAGHFQIEPETENKEPVVGEGNGFEYVFVPDPGVSGVRSRGLIVSQTNQITAVFLIRADADTNTHILTTVVQ